MKRFFKTLTALLGLIVSHICAVLLVLSMFILGLLGILLEYGLPSLEGVNTPFDYAKITDVEYTAEVLDSEGKGGNLLITERLTFDVHAWSKKNLYWELWRDLPESKVDGLKVDYEVHSVKQIMPDGSEVVYRESPRLYWDDNDFLPSNKKYGPGKWFHSEGPYDPDSRDYECLLFYVDGLYREEVVFEIQYEMHNASFRYNDSSDMYITMFSDTDVKDLESFKAQILIKNSDMPPEGTYKFFTYGTTGVKFPVEESDTMNPGYHTFYMDLDKSDLRFDAKTLYLDFELYSYGEGKHSFTEYAPDNNYTDHNVLSDLESAVEDYYKEMKDFYDMKALLSSLLFLTAILIFISALLGKRRYSKKYKFYKPERKYPVYREIPSDLDPYFAAEFLFSKTFIGPFFEDVFAALLLSLVRKKYIDFENNGTEDLYLRIYTTKGDHKPTEPLTECEEKLYNFLVSIFPQRHGSLTQLKQLIKKDFTRTTVFVSDIRNACLKIGTGQNYYIKYHTKATDSLMESFGLLIGVLFIYVVVAGLVAWYSPFGLFYGSAVLVGLALAFAAAWSYKLSLETVLYTKEGANEYEKWKGFYRFLKGNTLLKEKGPIEVALWEQYLVYATAFGVSKKVIKAIGVRCAEENMNPNDTGLLQNDLYRNSHFYACGRGVYHSITSGTRRSHVTGKSGVYTAGGFGGAASGGFGGGFARGGAGRGGGGGGGGH